jgi:HAE1 family hydrophobic/amphiphilic exporter-1
MRGKSTLFLLLIIFPVISVFLSGCVPGRREYFGDLGQRRMDAFHRWKENRAEDREKPLLEGPFSFEDAVRLTLAYNTRIQAILQEKELARGRIISAYSEALPSVDLAADYTRLDKVTTVDLGVESFQIGDQDNYSYRVTVTQPLFKGGVMRIAQRSARVFSYLSDEKVRAQVESAIFDVSRAYFDARLAEHLIEVQEAALQSAQQHLSDVESRFRHGTATEYDVLRATVDVSNIQADLIEQRNNYNRAITSLMKIVGASQRSEVEIVTDMEYIEVDADFAESIERAFANRPDLYQAELNVALQREAVKEAYSHYWPRLEAYFWNFWSKPDPHESSKIKWGDQWQAGLSLTWPLFDGLQREGQIIQQKALLDQHKILLSDVEEEAIQEVRNAILELENARELVESQRLNQQRADRALDLVQSGYKEGVNTAVEVLDAQVALTKARGLYYQALHRHIMARIDLKRAEGRLTYSPGENEVPRQALDPDKVLGMITNGNRGDQRMKIQGEW